MSAQQHNNAKRHGSTDDRQRDYKSVKQAHTEDHTAAESTDTDSDTESSPVIDKIVVPIQAKKFHELIESIKRLYRQSGVIKTVLTDDGEERVDLSFGSVTAENWTDLKKQAKRPFHSWESELEIGYQINEFKEEAETIAHWITKLEEKRLDIKKRIKNLGERGPWDSDVQDIAQQALVRFAEQFGTIASANNSRWQEDKAPDRVPLEVLDDLENQICKGQDVVADPAAKITSYAMAIDSYMTASFYELWAEYVEGNLLDCPLIDFGLILVKPNFAWLFFPLKDCVTAPWFTALKQKLEEPKEESEEESEEEILVD